MLMSQQQPLDLWYLQLSAGGHCSHIGLLSLPSSWARRHFGECPEQCVFSLGAEDPHASLGLTDQITRKSG
ncbi:hypothetical protein TNCV_475421 [Trichonephila clavipes]|nr:hypothetical protein TNCV_475421 [Trichonephila clavipes]